MPTAQSDFASLLQQYNSDIDDGFAGYKEASDIAKQIVSDESPVFCDSPSSFDMDVYCFDDESVSDVLSVVRGDRFELQQVVIPSITSIASDPRAVAERLRELVGIDVDVMLRSGSESSWVRVNAADGEFEALLDGMILTDCYALTKSREATKNDIRRWCDWDMQGGRAPLGFTWVDGELVPSSDYGEVCATLELVLSGEMSKNKAAAHLDTSSRTITRSICERSARYGL